MKRLIQVLLLLVVGLVLLPPLWFKVFPADPPPELPPAGRRVDVGGGIGVNVVEAGARAPTVLVHGLPGSAYVTDDFWNRECASLFPKSWVFVGFAHELANPGDIQPVTVAGKPLFLIRNQACEIRVFLRRGQALATLKAWKDLYKTLKQ